MHRPRLLSLLVLAAAATALADDAAKPGAKPAPKADGRKAAQPVAAAAAPAPRTLEEALRRLARRRVDVDFKEMALDEAVAFVGKVGGVNTMLSAVLQKKVGGSPPTVTLRLRDVSLRQFAELLAKHTGTALVLRDGVLQFTTPEDARGTPVLRVFSIADLTFRIRNFPAPDIQLHLGDAKYVQEEETDQAHPFDDPQTVVDLLKKFTGQGTWEDDDVSISADGNKLVVKQYPAVLKEISAFLAVLRAAK